jgi:glutamate-5-semialdehyde dehydrogenase
MALESGVVTAPAAVLGKMLKQARGAWTQWQQEAFSKRDAALAKMAARLEQAADELESVNAEEVQAARAAGLPPALLNRLALPAAAVGRLAQGLRALIALPDPLAQGRSLRVLPNGIRLEVVPVPLGVMALIFESRPGVTADAAGLALKSGNAVLLRGGREALKTNRLLARLLRDGLSEAGLPPDLVQLVDSADRAYVDALLHLDGLDLLIPRGGAGLIQRVKREATVPVIETGVGNCHVYVDQGANLDMALAIVRDAKVGNPAVCNAAETVLVHRAVAAEFLPRLEEVLGRHGVTLHAEPNALAYLSEAQAAEETAFESEYLSLDLAVRVVDDLEMAVDHIRQYGTGHSEAIVTNDYAAGLAFQRTVDAAVVYWNASTRFTDGGQFGFGTEVGISTQKLHARGPMGLAALTTDKTLAFGTGQTRDFPPTLD